MTSSTSTLDAAPGTPVAAHTAAKPAKVSKTGLVMAMIAVAAAAAGTGYYVTHRGLESTDDAQVDAEMVSVPTRTAGVVAKINFAENQSVKAGDVLAEIDAEPARARL